MPVFLFALFGFLISQVVIEQRFEQSAKNTAYGQLNELTAHLKDRILSKDKASLTDEIFDKKKYNPLLRYIIVLDEQNNILAQNFIGEVPSEILNTNLIPGGQTTSEVSLDYGNTNILDIGEAVFSGLYKVGTVRIGFDFGAAEKDIHSSIYLFSFIGIMTILVLAVIIIYLSNSITKPLKELTDAVEEFGKGNAEKRMNVITDDEIGKLATTFNAMADKLTESRRSLEKERLGIKIKIKELEDWQDATVGRELKMMELKKENEELKKKIGTKPH
jgi:HAMP domain-containing protein